MIWVAVFIGGGLGTMSRYALALLLNKWDWGHFPMATLVANALASFILGYLTFYGSQHLSKELQAGWMVGFCGGFSTFSTFTAENATLLENSSYLLLFLNIILSVSICLVFFFAGLRMAQ